MAYSRPREHPTIWHQPSLPWDQEQLPNSLPAIILNGTSLVFLPKPLKISAQLKGKGQKIDAVYGQKQTYFDYLSLVYKESTGKTFSTLPSNLQQDEEVV